METLKTKTTLSASELRIGNFIIDDDGLYSKVVGLSPFEHSVRCDEEEGCELILDVYELNGTVSTGMLCNSNFATPIPLSPDILLSAGFKYLKEEGVSSFEEFHNPDEDTHCWSFNVKSTDLIDSHEICLVKWGEEEYFTFQLGRGTYRKKIKYLHELQNGMFFLTGEELTINI